MLEGLVGCLLLLAAGRRTLLGARGVTLRGFSLAGSGHGVTVPPPPASVLIRADKCE
jgi:hypothetical protein